eukprot:6836908-Prymnesium_polylepis.1
MAAARHAPVTCAQMANKCSTDVTATCDAPPKQNDRRGTRRRLKSTDSRCVKATLQFHHAVCVRGGGRVCVAARLRGARRVRCCGGGAAHRRVAVA